VYLIDLIYQKWGQNLKNAVVHELKLKVGHINYYHFSSAVTIAKRR